MSVETRRLSHIHQLGADGQGFAYGNAVGSIRAVDSDKKLRQKAKRGEGLYRALEFPAVVGEEAIKHDNGNIYLKTSFAGETFYVDPRDPINGKDLRETLQGKQPEISIVSGPCLFSRESAVAVSASGNRYPITAPGVPIEEPVDHLDIDPRLSLYETEAIARLPHFIGAMLKGRGDIRNLSLNIPDVEYYLYMLEPYEQSLLSSEQLLEWFSHVDQRHDRLIRHMTRRATKDLPHRDEIIVTDTMPLAAIKPYVVDTVRQEKIPQFEEAQALLRESSPLWTELIDAQNAFAASDDSGRSRPVTTWQDINNLSYVYAELEAGDEAQSTSPDRPRVAIAVENPNESKIFAQAKRLAPFLRDRDRYNVIALFPHELVLPADGGDNKTMYHVPGQRIDLATAKTIFSAHK